MKLRKEQIRLSPEHPSLLLKLNPQPGWFAPLVVDQNGLLVDGYRRWQLSSGESISVEQVETTNLFDTAFDLNLRTRTWDSIDQFLWLRWATSLNIETDRIKASFPHSLAQAPRPVLESLAGRKLQLRQAQLILEAPARCRSILHELLTQRIQLNVNETARFIDMSCDLMVKLNQRSMEALFAEPAFAEILGNSSLTPKQKGEALLKIIRILRYPEYQRKLQGVSALWDQLGLGESISLKKSEFAERGVLVLSLTCRSREEMAETVERLHETLTSPVWDKIWEDT